MATKRTSRGFRIGEFTDHHGQICSIQESSLASERAIWLGVQNTGPFVDGPSKKRFEQVDARMHLTQQHVRDMLPALQHFAEYGHLPD